MARIITGMTSNASITPMNHASLQRKCTCGGGAGLSGECEDCRQKRLGVVQRLAANKSQVPLVPPIVHQVLASPGQRLDLAIRAFMEPRFGHDFSQVRVHKDNRASESARAVNALAYTVGSDVVFGAGQYSPQSQAGLRLMAHELTHVTQQSKACIAQSNLEIASSDTDSEQQADDIANQITKNQSLENDKKSQPVFVPMLMNGSYIQRQIEPVAIAERAGWWLATNAVSPGGGGFTASNIQFRYSPHVRGDVTRTEIPLLRLSDVGGAGAGGLGVLTQQLLTAGTGFSSADFVIRLEHDGANILWGETEVIMVDGYEGGRLGSEAQVNFSATPASHDTDPIAKARIIFSGWTNPIGPGFHRFSGSFFITAEGIIEEPVIRITQGEGWAITNAERRIDQIFEVSWLGEPSRRTHEIPIDEALGPLI